jgi:hypothetical protein
MHYVNGKNYFFDRILEMKKRFEMKKIVYHILIYLLVGIFVFIMNGCDNKRGFNNSGINKYTHTKYDRQGFDIQGYDKEGYDIQGYDREGYDREGYDREGYNKEDYDRKGFNRKGFNREGYDKEGYDREGYDKEGYDRKGYDKEGYDRKGFNKEGYDKEGYDKNGINKYTHTKYDKNGYDKNGINKYTHTKYDKNGYDKNGYDKNGLSKDCFKIDNQTICYLKTNKNVFKIISYYKRINKLKKEIKQYIENNDFDRDENYINTKKKAINALKLKLQKIKYFSLETNNYFFDNKNFYPDNSACCSIPIKYNLNLERYKIGPISGSLSCNLEIGSYYEDGGFRYNTGYFLSINGEIFSYNSYYSLKNTLFYFKFPKEKAKILKYNMKFVEIFEYNHSLKEKNIICGYSGEFFSTKGDYKNEFFSSHNIVNYEIKSKLKYICIISLDNNEIIYIKKF